MLEIEAWILAHMAYKNRHISKVWKDDDLKKWSDGMSDELRESVRKYYKEIISNEKRKHNTNS